MTVADKEGAVGVWDLTRPAPARAGRRRCSNICSTRRGSLSSSCRRRAARSICQLAQRVHQAHYYSSRRKSCLHTSRNGPTVHHTCSRFRLEVHTNTVRLSAMRHACLWPRVCALAPHVNTLGLLCQGATIPNSPATGIQAGMPPPDIPARVHPQHPHPHLPQQPLKYSPSPPPPQQVTVVSAALADSKSEIVRCKVALILLLNLVWVASDRPQLLKVLHARARVHTLSCRDCCRLR